MDHKVRNEERLKNTDLIKLCEDMIEATQEPRLVELRRNDAYMYREELLDRFSDLDDRYPAIFKMIMERGKEMDMNRLRFMLNALGQIQRGEVDKKEKLQEVSVKLHEDFNVPMGP
jgi:hypothetical protein